VGAPGASTPVRLSRFAVDLGDDTDDTTAAVRGQLAGACYGESGIPEPWRRRLALHDPIAALADRLWASR
jgi:ADP-ribosyl-[dinitrogen reductase] hydrolase